MIQTRDKMNGYVGFGVEVYLTNDGPKTIITIGNKKYPAEHIQDILDSVEPQIEEIKKKIKNIKDERKNEIKQLITVYEQTRNPIDKFRLLDRLIKIGADVSTIAVNIIDIKNKLGL